MCVRVVVWFFVSSLCLCCVLVCVACSVYAGVLCVPGVCVCLCVVVRARVRVIVRLACVCVNVR